MPHIIDLGAFRTAGTLVYAGRERGKLARRKAGLDKADTEPPPIEIRVPEDTFSITSSFFLGMFGPSVKKLGREGFLAQYVFTGWDMSPILEESIREALQTQSPL